MKQYYAVLVVALALSGSACQRSATVNANDAILLRVAKSLKVTSVAVGTIQDVTIAAHANGFISKDEAGRILALCQEVNLAAKDAVAITRGIARIDAPAGERLVEIFRPILSTTERTLIESGRIRDQTTRERIAAALTVLHGGLVAVNALLMIGG